MKEQKTYSINEREFTLKSDLTLKERDLIAKTLQTFKVRGYQIIGNVTLPQACEFFSTILLPTDKEPLVPSFFENVSEQVEANILAAFFLMRSESQRQLIRSWKTLDESSSELERNSFRSLK